MKASSDVWKKRTAAGVCYLCGEAGVPGLLVNNRPICRQHLLARRHKLCNQAATCSHFACAADGGSCTNGSEALSAPLSVEDQDGLSTPSYY